MVRAGPLLEWLWVYTRKAVCSNPSTVNWMEFFPLEFVENICILVRLKKTENKQKEAGNGPFLNLFLVQLVV